MLAIVLIVFNLQAAELHNLFRSPNFTQMMPGWQNKTSAPEHCDRITKIKDNIFFLLLLLPYLHFSCVALARSESSFNFFTPPVEFAFVGMQR